jgi:hypothetical protein
MNTHTLIEAMDEQHALGINDLRIAGMNWSTSWCGQRVVAVLSVFGLGMGPMVTCCFTVDEHASKYFICDCPHFQIGEFFIF